MCIRDRGGSGCWSSSRSWCSGRCGSSDCAVAARSCRSRRPVGIAPAVFVGTVLPDQLARSIAPVVNGLCASGGCERCRGKQHRHFVQFLHGSPLGEKAAAALRIRTPGVTTTLSVQSIVPYVTGQKLCTPFGARRTKPELLRYVASSLHGLTPKMTLLCRLRRPHDPVCQRNPADQP